MQILGKTIYLLLIFRVVNLQRCPECFKAVRARIKLYFSFVTVYSCCQAQCLLNVLIFNYIVMKVKVAQPCPTPRPHGLYIPWNSPGQNTGVGSLSLLQGIFPSQGSNPGLPHCRQILSQLNHREALQTTNLGRYYYYYPHFTDGETEG